VANGGCDKVVSGMTIPSLYRIRKDGEVVLFEEGAEKVILTHAQIMEMMKEGLRINDIFKRPVDIEFLFNAEGFYCLQARCITALPS